MKIKFIAYDRVNLGRDGFEFQYFYLTDVDNIKHKFHAVKTGNWLPISSHDEYSKNVFSSVVDFFTNFWGNNCELPNESEYYIGESYNMYDKLG